MRRLFRLKYYWIYIAHSQRKETYEALARGAAATDVDAIRYGIPVLVPVIEEDRLHSVRY